jgi:hypothetical protein
MNYEQLLEAKRPIAPSAHLPTRPMKHLAAVALLLTINSTAQVFVTAGGAGSMGIVSEGPSLKYKWGASVGLSLRTPINRTWAYRSDLSVCTATYRHTSEGPRDKQTLLRYALLFQGTINREPGHYAYIVAGPYFSGDLSQSRAATRQVGGVAAGAQAGIGIHSENAGVEVAYAQSAVNATPWTDAKTYPGLLQVTACVRVAR